MPLLLRQAAHNAIFFFSFFSFFTFIAKFNKNLEEHSSL